MRIVMLTSSDSDDLLSKLFIIKKKNHELHYIFVVLNYENYKFVGKAVTGNGFVELQKTI